MMYFVRRKEVRFCSVLLALVLVLGLMPMQATVASAEGSETGTEEMQPVENPADPGGAEPAPAGRANGNKEETAGAAPAQEKPAGSVPSPVAPPKGDPGAPAPSGDPGSAAANPSKSDQPAANPSNPDQPAAPAEPSVSDSSDAKMSVPVPASAGEDEKQDGAGTPVENPAKEPVTAANPEKESALQAQEDSTAYHKGDPCPNCGGTLRVDSFGFWVHVISCNSGCGFEIEERHYGGTATCTQKAVCDECDRIYGNYAEHSGGTATCTQKAKCENCSQEYGDPLGHDWVIDTSKGFEGWIWKKTGNAYSATACLKCQREGCGETSEVTDNTPSITFDYYSDAFNIVNLTGVATAQKDGQTFTHTMDLVDQPADRITNIWVVGDETYTEEPMSVPETINCHYQPEWWSDPVDSDIQVVEEDGVWYRDFTRTYTMNVSAKESYLQKVAATEATCTDPAYAEHYQCWMCKKRYTEKAALNEVTLEDLQTGPVVDHDWGEWMLSADGKNYTRSCQKGCGAVETTPAYSVTATVNDESMGTAGANPAVGASGETVTITATPKLGYRFREWVVSGATLSDAASEETTFEIGTENVSVQAVFEEIQANFVSCSISAPDALAEGEGGTILYAFTFDDDISLETFRNNLSCGCHNCVQGSSWDFSYNGGTHTWTIKFTFTQSSIGAYTRAEYPLGTERIRKEIGLANCEIRFDPGGGTVDPATARTNASARLSSFPTPVWEGHVFDGWYTSGNGGDLVTTDTVFTQASAIFAHWTVVTAVGEVPATCTETGTKAYYKDTYGNRYEKNGDAYTLITDEKTLVIPARGHTPGKAVRENERAATCTSAGGYDEVVYCTACKAEISRKTVTLPAAGHDYRVTGQSITTITSTCSRCGSSTWQYNSGSRNLLDGLVRDGNDIPVDYTAGVSETDGKQMLTVIPDLDSMEDLTDEMYLYLEPDHVKQWLREGISKVIFQRGDVSLEIDLEEISPDWFTVDEDPDTRSIPLEDRISFYVFTLCPTEGEIQVNVEILIGGEKTPADAFAGLVLKKVVRNPDTGETEILELEITENGGYTLE